MLVPSACLQFKSMRLDFDSSSEHSESSKEDFESSDEELESAQVNSELLPEEGDNLALEEDAAKQLQPENNAKTEISTGFISAEAIPKANEEGWKTKPRDWAKVTHFTAQQHLIF